MNNEEFTCSSCFTDYIGEATRDFNGCQLCASCRNAKVYTAEEIAKYIAGWTMGSFDEVRKLGSRVTHNALVCLRDDQDGIEAMMRRRR